jgi:hypothetical protein
MAKRGVDAIASAAYGKLGQAVARNEETGLDMDELQIHDKAYKLDDKWIRKHPGGM